MRCLLILALCLPLLAEEPPKKPPHVTAENDPRRPNSTSTTPPPQGVPMNSDIPIMLPGGGEPTVAALKADLAYANARIEALSKQLAFEMQSCWQIETMLARFEAAKSAKEAEKLKPVPEPKKK